MSENNDEEPKIIQEENLSIQEDKTNNIINSINSIVIPAVDDQNSKPLERLVFQTDPKKIENYVPSHRREEEHNNKISIENNNPQNTNDPSLSSNNFKINSTNNNNIIIDRVNEININNSAVNNNNNTTSTKNINYDRKNSNNSINQINNNKQNTQNNNAINNSNLSNNTNSSLPSQSSKKRNNEKKSQKGMKDFAFKFPLANSFSKVEIPFAFQQNLEEKNNKNRFHSYITIKDTPKLYLDISDDKKMDGFLLSSTIENLKVQNQKKETKLQGIDMNIIDYKTKNDKLREEIEMVRKEVMIRRSKIDQLKQTIQQINQNNNKYTKEMMQKINEKNLTYKSLKDKYEKIEKEIQSKNSIEEKKEYLAKIQEEVDKIQKEYHNNFKYYSNKFRNSIYTDDYTKNCLQKDLIDFMTYVTQKIQIIQPKVKDLLKYIQMAVDKSIGNQYEVKLYGSHATGLCLPWSDIDVVICKKNGESFDNSYLALHDLYTYLQNKNEFKSIGYIGATAIPLIKIKTKENLGIQNIDISLQDKSHYGIKCVSLMLSFKEEYEVLLPMILALKNILKQANLNDPYKVSHFILIIYIHIFLNIGRIKFLWFSLIDSTFFKTAKRSREINSNESTEFRAFIL